MKRFVTMLFAALLLASLALPGFAEEGDNTCGEGLTWSYSAGTLTISGSGDMDDFPDGAPWDGYVSQTTALVLTGGVAKVGAEAFSGFTELTDIDFGTSLREIGENAFRGCTGLTAISLPKTFRLFGPGCFQDCTGLTEVHCAGGMPSFRSNCLWNGSHITVFCPDENVWSEKYVGELETNFGGRLEVLTESGKDVYTWPDETVAPTEAATVPTTQPTQSATQPVETTQPTVPAATAAPATQPAQTQPTTQPEETTQPPETQPEPQEPTREPISGLLVGTFLISGTLSLILIGMLLFKPRKRRR